MDAGGDQSQVPLYANDHYLQSSQSHALLRQWSSGGISVHRPSEFILPLFVLNDDDKVEEIKSMPGVSRMGCNQVISYLKPLVDEFDLKCVLLFPVLKDEDKDDQLKTMTNWNFNPVLRLLPKLRQLSSELLIAVDVCLCGFTQNGHCGVFKPDTGLIDNEKSCRMLSKLSLAYAKAGAHVIAPSDMMDARVGAIRSTLNVGGFNHISIMSYSAKFASSFYGPFRDAAGSAPKFGDRKCYQLPPGSRNLALRAVKRDIEEGADIVMVKPGLPYLDIVEIVSKTYPNYPVAVYHVSGEYAMLRHGANNGSFDLKSSVNEIMTCFKRAGARIIITYFTPDLLQWMKQDSQKQ